MHRKFTPLLLLLLTASPVRSEQVTGSLESFEVVFLSQRDGKGMLVDLEPGQPDPEEEDGESHNHTFFHVAIREAGSSAPDAKWLHAHPRGGVQRSARMESFGQVELVVKFQTAPHISKEQRDAWLGLPYESDFGWETEALYCSKLVGKILGMRPSPMKFEGPYWDRYFAQTGKTPPEGLGISPDGLYARIIRACKRKVLLNCEFLPACNPSLTPPKGPGES